MYKALIALATGVSIAVLPLPVAGLECPVLHPVGSSRAIAETAAAVAEDGSLLSTDVSGSAIGKVISRLREAHPDASNAEIQNYLLTAFCPSLVQRGYDEAKTTQMFDDFTKSVEAELWGSPQ